MASSTAQPSSYPTAPGTVHTLRIALRSSQRYARSMQQRQCLIVGSSILFALAASIAPPAAAEPVSTKQGVVATAHPAGSRAGLEMLQAGGNAADAAAAAAFVLGVVEPYSSGLGGGGFATIRFGDKVVFVDFREEAPKKAARDMYMEAGEPQPERSRDGILAAGVPGAVAGYLHLQQTYGKLPRKRVLEPAVRLAEEGFTVDARFRAYAEWRLDVLRRDREAARIFLVPGEDGQARVPPLGHRIVQKDLATTLRAIAAKGESAFYSGKVAKRLAADMKSRGGLIRKDDLAAYHVVERAPIVGHYRGHAIASAPPPSSGGQILLTILNVMETLPDGHAWHSTDALHTYIEAAKRAFADRQLLGDPEFVEDITDNLIAKDRAALLAKVIGKHATPSEDVPPGQGAQLPPGTLPKREPAPEGQDTTHLSVLDRSGNAVAMTTTVNYGWGAGVVAKGTGVIWNDEMDDFAIAPGVPNTYGIVGSEANGVQPRKRPLSSMAPTLVFQGASTQTPVRLVVGSPGGPRIPTTVAQVILNHLAYDAPIDRAVALGRVHHQHLPQTVYVERFALDPATRRALEARGHKLEITDTWSNANAIAVDPETGVRTAAADPRGIGAALTE